MAFVLYSSFFVLPVSFDVDITDIFIYISMLHINFYYIRTRRSK